MNWKETYTKVFLNQLGKSVNEVTLKEYLPLWWKNTRVSGGLRLTELGFDLLTEIDVSTYEIPYPKDMPLTTQIIIFLDKFIECPYYLTNRSIVVTDEKKAIELHLFSGDLRKYGITKAMKRQEKNQNP
jgi:hypothetical protein